MPIKIGKKLGMRYRNQYVIIHKYIIGDSDGEETFEQIVSMNNPYLERFLACCTHLTDELPGTWGNILEEETINKLLGEEASFFKEFTEEYCITKDIEDYELELAFYIRTESDLSFYTYQGFDIDYIDNDGVKHECEFTLE